MELQFQTKALEGLCPLLTKTITRELTLELPVPEDLGDVSRVVQCWALPVVEKKTWSGATGPEGTVHNQVLEVTGGLQVMVLVESGNGGSPVLSGFVPFGAQWPAVACQDPQALVQCQLQSLDCRLSGSRKVLVRGTLALDGIVYGQKTLDVPTLAQKPEHLQVLEQEHRLQLVLEQADKTISLQETLDLPQEKPDMGKILAYTLRPQVEDSKVLGKRGVLKGQVHLELLYGTQTGSVATHTWSVPFSQVADLSRSYEDEESFPCTLLLSALDLELEEDGTALHMGCTLNAQCRVMAQPTVILVQDLYSLTEPVESHCQSLGVHGYLGRQVLTQPVQLPVPKGTLVAWDLHPGFPQPNQDQSSLNLSLWYSLLYTDQDGTLQSRQSHSTQTIPLQLAPNCRCTASVRSWSLGSGNSLTGTLPVNLTLDLELYTRDPLSPIAQVSLQSPPTAPQPGSPASTNIAQTGHAPAGSGTLTTVYPDHQDRPSVLLRRVHPGETLWSIAKTHRTTRTALQEANGNLPDPPTVDQWMLIPLLE